MNVPYLLQRIEEIDDMMKQSFFGEGLDLNLLERSSVEEIENIVFPYQVFSSLDRRLYHTIKELADISITPNSSAPRNTNELLNVGINVELAWINIFTTLHTLAKSMCDIDLLTDEKFKNEYPELQYCRLLRNDFIHHPNISCPIFSLGTGCIQVKNELPICWFAPGGYGWTKYWKHFEDSITDDDFKGLTAEEKMRRNKELYVRHGGWKSIKGANGLVSKIKAYGLPPPDQKKLSDEIYQIYDSKIVPFLKNRFQQMVTTNIVQE